MLTTLRCLSLVCASGVPLTLSRMGQGRLRTQYIFELGRTPIDDRLLSRKDYHLLSQFNERNGIAGSTDRSGKRCFNMMVML